MDKKRKIILAIQIIIFTLFLLFFTLPAQDETSIARLKIGGLFLAVGLILLTFTKPIAEWMYKRQIQKIKESSSVENFTNGIKHGGILISSVGIILILFGLIFK